MTYVPSFNQSMDEYDKFNRLVSQFKGDLANDPTSILNGTSTAENELVAIAKNSADPDFSLIEGTAWMHKFGISLTTAIDSAYAQASTATVVLSGSILGGSAVKIVDQNGNPIAGNILAEIQSGAITSISFNTVKGLLSTWNLPASLESLYEDGSSGISIVGTGGTPGKTWTNGTVTVSGSALTTFITQALQNGELNMGGIDTSGISAMLAQFGY